MRRLEGWPWPFLLMLVGAAAATAPLLPRTALPPELILFVFLPALLFDAALSMRASAIRRELHWILLLGVAGSVAAAALTYALLRVLGFPRDSSLLLAALLAATDPVSVFAVMRSSHGPPRVRVVLEGESLANDGVAVVLFALALGVVRGASPDPAALLVRFFWLSAGGLVVGTVLGALAAPIVRRVSVPVGVAVTVLFAYGGFLLAEGIGASGLLSVIAAGLWLGNLRSTPGLGRIERFWRGAGLLFAAAAYLMMGLQLALDRLMQLAGSLALLAATVLLARTAMIAGLTTWPARAWPARWQAAMIWAGLRGALSLALALSIPAEVAGRETILLLASGFVLISLIAQGFSVGPVFRWLGLEAAPSRAGP